MIDCPSPNFDDRGNAPVTMLVLHYTGMESADAALQRLTDAEAKVSSHYMLAEDGTCFRLVPEEKRAWHAGRSYWRGTTNVNAASIGIEIVNPGHELGYRPFTDAQMDVLLPLVAEIVRRHGIEPAMVVGHSDIAPTRKVDPGELFDWPLLARHRLALGPVKPIADPHWTDPGTLQALHRFGYDVTDGPAAVRAFQRRFRPKTIDGIIDGETRGILLTLLIGEMRGLDPFDG
jgi:N-acetylmuramoyl-L-alanine amidase